MEQVRFARRDAKIIKDNPGKSPYELKELGISDKAFEKLMTLPNTEAVIIADGNIDDDGHSLESVASNNTSEVKLVQLGDKNAVSGLHGIDSSIEGRLLPKITSFKEASYIPHMNLVSPKQVIMRSPNGRVNPMGREFALKLIAQNAGYSIIE